MCKIGKHFKLSISCGNSKTASHTYSHLSNSRGRGGWNKHGGDAKVAKSINAEVGINVKGGIFWKKLVHNCNKREINKCGGWKCAWRMVDFFSKSVSVTSRLLEMRVLIRPT